MNQFKISHFLMTERPSGGHRCVAVHAGDVVPLLLASRLSREVWKLTNNKIEETFKKDSLFVLQN